MEGEEELADAARREVAEETGITGIELGPLVARRSSAFSFDGRSFDQDEWYYLARTGTTALDASGQTELELRTVDELRWWTLPELLASTETVYPEGLGSLLASLLAAGPPDRPVRLPCPTPWSTMDEHTHS